MDPVIRPTAKKLLLSPLFASHGLHAPEDAQNVSRNTVLYPNSNAK